MSCQSCGNIPTECACSGLPYPFDVFPGTSEWEECKAEYASLLAKLQAAETMAEGLVRALEQIADPRKRDHKEPDAYTTLGCVMKIADDALAEFRKGAG